MLEILISATAAAPLIGCAGESGPRRFIRGHQVVFARRARVVSCGSFQIKAEVALFSLLREWAILGLWVQIAVSELRDVLLVELVHIVDQVSDSALEVYILMVKVSLKRLDLDVVDHRLDRHVRSFLCAGNSVDIQDLGLSFVSVVVDCVHDI